MLRYLCVITFLLVLFECQFSNGCECPDTHPQTQYCESDFVLIAVPTKVSKPPTGQYAYTIRILTTLKADAKAIKALKSNKLYTEPDSQLCGFVNLPLNDKYIFSGFISDSNVPMISLCGFNVKLSEVFSPNVKRGFLCQYKNACGCEINICRNGEPCLNSKDACRLTYEDSIINTPEYKSMCKRDSTGVCTWINI